MLGAMFRAKQSNFEQLYAKKELEKQKKHEKSNLARNFKYVTIVFDSNHFNTII